MSNDIVTLSPDPEPYELSVTPRQFEVITHTRETILKFIQTQLRRNVDYGKIPGCGDKDVLFQPGVQKICALMRVYPDDDVTITDLGNGHREYLVKTRLKHTRPDGIEITVATGQGSCCTRESKYAYRNDKRRCPDCHSDALVKTSRGKYWCPQDRGGCGNNFALNDKRITDQQIGKVENPDIADTYNTVLKMAIKRANMGATLNLAGGWTDRFNQDVDDADAPADKPDNAPPDADKPDNAPPPQQSNKALDAIRDDYKHSKNAFEDQEFKTLFEANRKEFLAQGMTADDAALNAYDKTLST